MFTSFLAEDNIIYFDGNLQSENNTHDLIKGMGSSFEKHGDFSDQVQRSFLRFAKDEIIASSRNKDYRRLEELQGNWWQNFLVVVRGHLWGLKDIGREEKEKIYNLYFNKFKLYLEHVRNYQWVTHNLFQRAKQDDVNEPFSVNRQQFLTEASVEAKLQHTRIDRAKRLGPYFGVKPEDFQRSYREDELKLVEDFSKKVDNALDVQKSDQRWEMWNEKVGWDKMSQIRGRYPVGAVSALKKLIEGSANPNYIRSSIATLELILHLNFRNYSVQELDGIATSLRNMTSMRTEGDYEDVREKANSLIFNIDKVYKVGGYNF